MTSVNDLTIFFPFESGVALEEEHLECVRLARWQCGEVFVVFIIFNHLGISCLGHTNSVHVIHEEGAGP